MKPGDENGTEKQSAQLRPFLLAWGAVGSSSQSESCSAADANHGARKSASR